MANTTKNKEDQWKITVVKNMRDYSNDPVFKKRAEQAAAFLKKYGLPKEFSEKSK